MAAGEVAAGVLVGGGMTSASARCLAASSEGAVAAAITARVCRSIISFMPRTRFWSFSCAAQVHCCSPAIGHLSFLLQRLMSDGV